MSRQPVAKRPAHRRSNGWTGLPLAGSGARFGTISTCGKTLERHIIEGILTCDGGRVLGHLMLRMVAVHPSDALG
eukprot:1375444-Amphidinium_carterae.1